MEKKKIIASILGATLMTSPQVNAEENYSLGDVNFNGMVSADDASMVLMEYSRNSTGEKETFTELQKKLADIDKNGKIDATDATMILKYYAYLSTGGKLSFEEYLKEGETPVIQTTTSTTLTTTSTTTQTTIPTTTVVTTQPETRRDIMYEYMKRNDYTKYDLMSEDSLEARFALEKLSEQLNNELFQGSMSGSESTYVLMSVLNYNQNLNKEALDYLYSNFDEESFKQASDNIDFAYNEMLYKTEVDFTKYVIDEEFAELLNRVTSEYRDYNNNIYEPLINEIENYFQNNYEVINNYVEYYFMYKTNENLYYKTYDTGDVQQMYFDNAVVPLYKSFKEKKIIENKTTSTTSTTTQTTIPTTTVTIQPVIKKENYTKYDLLDANPEIAAKAYERLSEELCKELLDGKAFYSEYGSTGGKDEAKVMLAVLNRNQGISMEMLARPEALGNYTEDEIVLFSGLDASSAILEDMAGTTVDYTKYVLDEEYANFMNNTSRAFKEYQKGNFDEYNEISENYFNLNQFDDYVKCYYMVLNDNMSNKYTSDETVDYTKNMYIENIIKPLYESYAPYKGHSYNR